MRHLASSMPKNKQLETTGKSKSSSNHHSHGQGKRDRDCILVDAGGKEKKLRKKSPKSFWLRENIRVRVISKHLSNGKSYLKKGTVIDMVGPDRCTLNIDGLGIVHNVSQGDLETVVPREEGTLLIVVMGRHRGELCRLVHRNSKEGCATVTFVSDYSFHSVDLDNIAAYAGPADDC